MDKATEAARANGYIDGLKGQNSQRNEHAPGLRTSYDMGYRDGARVRSLGFPSSRKLNTGAIPSAARYEPETKTIRSVPGNHWLASMDSWDGSINHEANAEIFASAFEMRGALCRLLDWIDCGCDPSKKSLQNAREILERLP